MKDIKIDGDTLKTVAAVGAGIVGGVVGKSMYDKRKKSKKASMAVNNRNDNKRRYTDDL